MTRQRLRVRVCRPDDHAAVQRLFKTCIVYGAQSPARISASHGLWCSASFLILAYSLFLLCITSGSLWVLLSSTFYFSVLFYGRIAFYVDFAYTSVKDDLSRITEHYELEPGQNGEYGLTGRKGFWVAEIESDDGEKEIVGYVGLDISSIHGPSTGEMRRMVVSPYHRRLGIATTLMNTCEAHAKKHDFTSVVLTTTEFQPHARSLYEKFGYEVIYDRLKPSGLAKIHLLDYRKTF